MTGCTASLTVPCSRSKPIKQVASEYEVDGILADLQSQSARWKALPLKDKVTLLSQVRDRALKASKVLGIVTAKVCLLVSASQPSLCLSLSCSQITCCSIKQVSLSCG